jgi:hypothetical protein
MKLSIQVLKGFCHFFFILKESKLISCLNTAFQACKVGACPSKNFLFLIIQMDHEASIIISTSNGKFSLSLTSYRASMIDCWLEIWGQIKDQHCCANGQLQKR